MKIIKLRRFVRILIALTLLLSGLFTVSCKSGRLFASDVVAEAVSAFDIQPPGIFYIFGAAEGDKGYLDAKTKSALFGRRDDEKNYSFEYLCDYALFVPAKQTAFEIDAFFVRNLENVEDIENMCQKRIESLQSAAESFSAEDRIRLSGAEVFTCGRDVYLLITPDNALAKAVIKSFY